MDATNGRSATFNRVLIVDNQGIMGAGLERLLSEEPALEVFGVTVDGEKMLIQEIWRLQPDSIILIEESEGISPIRLMKLLKDYGRLRIIVVSTNSNVFEVYDKQQILTGSYLTLMEQLKDK